MQSLKAAALGWRTLAGWLRAGLSFLLFVYLRVWWITLNLLMKLYVGVLVQGGDCPNWTKLALGHIHTHILATVCGVQSVIVYNFHTIKAWLVLH